MPELSAYLFLVSLLGMGLLTPLVIRLGNRWSVVDIPGPRKIHQQSVALSGGWAVFLTLSLVLWVHLGAASLVRGTSIASFMPEKVQYFIDHAPKLVEKVLPVYIGATAIFAIGLVDDVKGMSVKSRLLCQVVIASLLAVMGLRPSVGVVPPWVSAVLGVLWIVGITNAFNFLDGLDGLSSGVAFVACASLLAIMVMGTQPDMTFFLAALAGVILGFLRFNFHPAKVFLGSSGSLLLGYLMGVSTSLVTYLVGRRGNWLIPLLTPLFVLAIPIYDTCSVVIIRLLQKRPVGIGDQSHFHHRLMRLGFSQKQAVVFICLLSLAVALSAVRLVEANLLQSMIILAQILGILAILVLAERVAYRAHREKVVERSSPLDQSSSEASLEHIQSKSLR